MEQTKYHPLVDCDTDGAEKVPMFCSTDANTISRIKIIWNCIGEFNTPTDTENEKYRHSR